MYSPTIDKVGIVIYDMDSLEDEEGPAEMLLDKTKGTSTYSLGTIGDSLYLCCAIKSNITLFRWSGDSFLPVQLIQLNDEPNRMEFIGADLLLVGLPGEFTLVNFEQSTSTALVTYSSKEPPVDILVLDDDYLLCYSSMYHSHHSYSQARHGYICKYRRPPHTQL